MVRVAIIVGIKQLQDTSPVSSNATYGLSCLSNRNTCIHTIYILSTSSQIQASYHQHLVSFRDLRFSNKNPKLFHNMMFETPWLCGPSPLVLSRKHKWLLGFTLNVPVATWKYIRGDRTTPVRWPLLTTPAARLTGWPNIPFSNSCFCDSWQVHKRRAFEEEFQWRWGNAMHSDNLRRIKKLLKTRHLGDWPVCHFKENDLFFFAIWTSRWEWTNLNRSFKYYYYQKNIH